MCNKPLSPWQATVTHYHIDLDLDREQWPIISPILTLTRSSDPSSPPPLPWQGAVTNHLLHLYLDKEQWPIISSTFTVTRSSDPFISFTFTLIRSNDPFISFTLTRSSDQSSPLPLPWQGAVTHYVIDFDKEQWPIISLTLTWNSDPLSSWPWEGAITWYFLDLYDLVCLQSVISYPPLTL